MPAKDGPGKWTAVVVALVCGVYVGCYAAVILLVEGDPQAAVEGLSHTTVFLCAASGFFAIAAVEASWLLVASASTRSRFTCITIGCSLVGCGNYLAAGLELVPVFFSPDSGVLVYPGKFMSWAFSCGLMIYCVWEASTTSFWLLLLTILTDSAMIGGGVLSIMSEGPIVWLWFIMSASFFVITGSLQWRMLGTLMDTLDGLEKSQAAVHKIRLSFVGIWLIFPTTFLFQMFSTKHGSEQLARSAWVVEVFFDVFAKAILAAFSQSILSTSADKKQLKLQSMAENLVHQLVDMNDTKDRFSTAVADELRAPVAGMVNLTKSVLHTYGDDMHFKCRQAITTVTDMGERFRVLLDNILGSYDGGEESDDTASTEVQYVMREAVAMVEPLITPRTKLSVHVPAGLPPVKGDFSRIMQVVFNVLSNTAKLTTRGTLSLSAKLVPGMLHLDISSNGASLTVDEMANLLTATTSSGPNAPNIALARRLARTLDGDVIIQTSSSDGMCVAILLPVVDLALASDTPVSAATPHSKFNAEFTADTTVIHIPAVTEIASITQRKKKKTPNKKSSFTQTATETDSLLPSRSSDQSITSWITNKRSMADMSGICEMGTAELLCIGGSKEEHTAIRESLAGSNLELVTVKNVDDAEGMISRRIGGTGRESSLPAIVLVDQQASNGPQAEKLKKLHNAMPTVPIMLLAEGACEGTHLASLLDSCNDFVRKPLAGSSELSVRLGVQMKHRDRLLADRKRANQSDQILQDILPPSVIKRLSEGQRLIADELDEVTVIFSDIVGFTELTSMVSTEQIIDILDKLFCQLDAMTERRGVHKVETIGDCYMIVCGHDEATRGNHALIAMQVAMEMVAIAGQLQRPDGKQLQVRVGMHSGPVYAGVVGYKGPRYCLFGDTVNTASRMESNSFPMCVHLSDSTYKLVQRDNQAAPLEFLELPNRSIKGKGSMTTYLLKWGNWEAAAEKMIANDSIQVAISGNSSSSGPQPGDDELGGLLKSTRAFRPYQNIFSSAANSPAATTLSFDPDVLPCVPSNEAA